MTASVDDPIIVGGASRSGTTLMRVLLDSHPDICCGPEIKVLRQVAALWRQIGSGPLLEALADYDLSPADVNERFAAFAHSFVRPLQERSGSRRWAEKTPTNLQDMDFFLSVFPRSCFIHVIRDGRDVCCSLTRVDWLDPASGEKVWYTRDVRSAALYWKACLGEARAFIGQNPRLQPRYAEVRYEALVTHSEKILRQLMAFCGEPFHDQMLHHEDLEHRWGQLEESSEQLRRPVHGTSIGRWQRDLSEDDRATFKDAAGDLLVQLGYAVDDEW